ncbi:hypothetical protein D3C83_29950 [compost metagenome]
MPVRSVCLHARSENGFVRFEREAPVRRPHEEAPALPRLVSVVRKLAVVIILRPERRPGRSRSRPLAGRRRLRLRAAYGRARG